jgi:signal transduction histidine kinase
VVAGQTGRRRISPRRAAALLGQKEPRPVPSRAARRVDVAIAAVATIVALVVAIGQFRTQAPMFGISPWTLLGVALTTAPLAFRRTYPITAFWVIMAAIVTTSGSTHTVITFASVIFAAYCAAAYSPFRRLALASVLAAGIVVTAAYPDTAPPVPARFGALLVLLPTVAVGNAIRTWRRRAGESAERLRLAQQEHEAETRRAVQEERARIASEMHDVVTHNVSVMVVQAGAARRVLDSSPGAAREALLAVEASGRTAMTELRNLLGLLAPSGEAEPGPDEMTVPGGAGDAALTPQPGVARIPALLARVGEIGMPVELTVDALPGTSPVLPPGIDLAAYRVVQEALTNVMKHAGPARTTVRLQYRPRDLLITVSDDGPPDSASAAAGPGVGVGEGTGPGVGVGVGEGAGPGSGSVSGGRGLIGLRERIAVYGGELDAGPRPGGGWRLRARIPLEPVAGDLPVPPEFQGVVP